VASLIALSTLSSCRGGGPGPTTLHDGDDVARLVKTYANDAEDLARGRWAPREAPPLQGLEPSPTQIENAAAQLATPIIGLQVDDAKAVVVLSCEASDALTVLVSPTPQEISDYMTAHAPGQFGYRAQAEQLTAELSKAKTSFDQAQVLGQAALCQWASM
jgi:hypothetical protein